MTAVKKLNDNVSNADQGLDDTPTTSQEQILLEALQGFILPHISAGVNANRQKEMAQKLSGPHAKKFITALKEFISSFVRMPAQTEGETTIKVALAEDDNGNEQVEGKVTSPEFIARSGSSDANLKNQNLTRTKSVITLPTIYDKVLLELRSLVFNKMPIRLLKFVAKGPILEISLIERAAIYKHLVSILPPLHDHRKYMCTLRDDFYGRSKLETESEAASRIAAEYSNYAILSHTWLRQSPELAYGNWKARSFDTKGPGYRKLVNFCKVASTMHGLTLGWMDTVCINHDSSSELDESIRSMYQWYKRSKVCIVHLADTKSLAEMHQDSWFMRGWTLQELLAPNVLKFYDQSWKQLVISVNDKKHDSITSKIRKATTISTYELDNIRTLSISRKMQLAAPRKVTREEDTAYSLMGLFDVSIATAYGEGADRAFYRLLQEILTAQSYGVLDLFNWAGRDSSSSSMILPKSPHQYLARSPFAILQFSWPIEPLTLTHMGVRIPLLLMPGISIQPGASSIKPCGNYSALVSISLVRFYDHLPTTYTLLQQQESRSDSITWSRSSKSTQHQFTFAVLNISQKGQDIIIPSKCFAIPLACYEATGKVSSTGDFNRIHTKDPVVFDMLKRNPKQSNSSAEDYMLTVKKDAQIRIPQEDLAKHGMQLVFKYL